MPALRQPGDRIKVVAPRRLLAPPSAAAGGHSPTNAFPDRGIRPQTGNPPAIVGAPRLRYHSMTSTMDDGDRQETDNSMHSTDTAAQFIIGGVIFTAFGMIYQFKPDLFRRWFWKRTSIAQRLLSPENYLRYMRVLGVLYIIGGVAAAGYGISLLH